MHIIASKAVAFEEALQPSFKEYQGRIVKNAASLAEALLKHDFHLVSGGTDNHLILINLTSRGVTGKALETALDKAGITVNKNTVPFDTQSPFITSGVRIGTPAVTTRGFGSSEMEQIASWMDEVAKNVENDKVLSRIRAEVLDLCGKYPLYAGM